MNLLIRLKYVISYRPHPKDGEGNVFTGVCLFTRGRGGGGYHSPVTGPVQSFAPGPARGIGVPLVLSKVLSRVLSGE